MNRIKDLHNKSMELSELAFLSKIKGDNNKSYKLFSESLKYELEAISIFDNNEIIEPTYSILHRSAATLALDCGDPRKAEQIISKSLALNPPDEIAEELRDLLEQVNLQRHLKLRGISLNSDELQINVTGKSVGFGFVPSEELLKRVKNTSKMLFRIVERKDKIPFREKGRIKKDLKNNYEIYMSVPRAASFSITLKVGIPSDQKQLPGFCDTPIIIDEFMDLISLVNDNKLDNLKDRIGDSAYYRNFIGLAKSIAPDRNDIKQVGFTSQRGGKEHYSLLSTPKNSFPIIEAPDNKKEIINIEGNLKFADDTHGSSGLIKIIDLKGKAHKISVPKGMMNDIVRPMFNSAVRITGHKLKNKIELIDINELG